MKQYSMFILKEDLNPNIKKGMKGYILEIYDKENFEVEFVKDDGTNFTFENEITFAVNLSQIEPLK